MTHSLPLHESALDQLFHEAHTANGYLDKPVSEDQLRAIFHHLKMAPTSFNSLPARFTWITSQAGKERLAKHAMAKNADKILAAPVSVIIAMDEEFHEHLPDFFPAMDAKAMFDGAVEKRRDTAFRNSSLQGAYFIMAARALGLDVGPMSGFDNAAVDAEFFVETPNIKSNFISTLGYGDPAAMYPRSPRPDFERFNAII